MSSFGNSTLFKWSSSRVADITKSKFVRGLKFRLKFGVIFIATNLPPSGYAPGMSRPNCEGGT